MRAFELAYEKYELKLKIIEEELLDYNTKSKELDSSPIRQNLKQRQIEKIESPQTQH